MGLRRWCERLVASLHRHRCRAAEVLGLVAFDVGREDGPLCLIVTKYFPRRETPGTEADLVIGAWARVGLRVFVAGLCSPTCSLLFSHPCQNIV